MKSCQKMMSSRSRDFIIIFRGHCSPGYAPHPLNREVSQGHWIVSMTSLKLHQSLNSKKKNSNEGGNVPLIVLEWGGRAHFKAYWLKKPPNS
jgi:hypothetical protein